MAVSKIHLPVPVHHRSEVVRRSLTVHELKVTNHGGLSPGSFKKENQQVESLKHVALHLPKTLPSELVASLGTLDHVVQDLAK